MHKTHASNERNDAPCHDFVLAEKAIIADVAASQPEPYDDNGEDGAPPTVEKSRIVCDAGPAVWWGGVEKLARYYHAAEQPEQTLASVEGELLGCRVLSVAFESQRWRLRVLECGVRAL